MTQHLEPTPPNGGKGSPAKKSRIRKRHRGWRVLGWIVVVTVVLGGVARALLPWAVRHYVNRTLDRNLLYEGKIGDVEIHLWRGAYSIHDVTISKRTGTVPVPFFAAHTVDFSIQWDALLHRKIVGQMVMQAPQINFVASPNENTSQTGSGGSWLEMIRDLFPFTINSAVIRNGSIHFRTYQSQKPVDVYLSQLEATVSDLSNIRNEINPLVTTVNATALAMDQANLEMKMTLDPFSYRPTFHLALRLLGLNVTNLNDLTLTYGDFNFKRGWFDLVIEADDKEGQLTGYVKPLFRNLKVFSLRADLKEDDVLQFFVQALLGATTTVLKNFPRDQFGTLIPFTADTTTATTADILATIGNILRNAFVRAYLPRLQPGLATENNLQFGPPQFGEALSTVNQNQ